MSASSVPFQRPNPAFWVGKRVLVTGHTGFKGGWLSVWLAKLGAKVTGVGLVPESTPSLFELADIAGQTTASHIADIRDVSRVSQIVTSAKPEIIFHLAAQSLVLPSYENPLDTFATNIQGTANLLEAARGAADLKAVIVVTTDKVYENSEAGIPFQETDSLGGYDPYSASKAAAEIVASSYRRSFLADAGVVLATARAGNVIGGGDWAKNRLMPDAVRAWESGNPLEIRHPEAVRPWQHVLEPLAGYLCLCERMWESADFAGSFNFGPASAQVATVQRVIELARQAFGRGEVRWGKESHSGHEANYLSLDTTKVREQLGIVPRWDLEVAVARTFNWYLRLANGANALQLCINEIGEFESARPDSEGVQ